MNARDVLDSCRRAFVLVTREGENVGLEPLFPDEHPMPTVLVDLVREHKPQIIEWLRYQEHADELLLESTRRLGAAWPEGCPLEGPSWDALEQRLHKAYWSGRLEAVTETLAIREAYALQVFDHYRDEVHHDTPH
jgi:hypothetical protein